MALTAHLDLLNFPEVKALYDAANTAATIIAERLENDEVRYWASEELGAARKLLVDALIAFREG